jgi:hypothetical protein
MTLIKPGDDQWPAIVNYRYINHMAAVLNRLGREEPVHLISRRYGIQENTLWRDPLLKGGKSGSSNGKKKLDKKAA